ncbi:MAG: DUF2202 domain-containing protein [Paracoccaceae bacterium]
MAKSLVTVQTTPLDEAAISDLLYMLEEEKLAGDIYEAFYDLYGTTVFDQIAASEDSHYAALVGQADLIGLDISAIEATPAGEFLNDDLQALYDALLAWGSTSEADALLVGVTIEETDIVDIAEAIDGVPGTTLATVYQNLMDGSWNHLGAFESAVTAVDPSIIFGTEASELIRADSTDNTIWARDGDDTVKGLSGDDTIYGEGGDDLLDGGRGRDRLYGESGADTLYGGNGRDRLFGGTGKDRLIGEAGDDRLKGGAQADDFVFRDGFGNDTVLDFDTGNNREDIVLRGVTAITDWDDLVAHHLGENAEGDAVIDAGDGNTITLVGVSMADLDQGDFQF